MREMSLNFIEEKKIPKQKKTSKWNTRNHLFDVFDVVEQSIKQTIRKKNLDPILSYISDHHFGFIIDTINCRFALRNKMIIFDVVGK